MTLNNKKKNQLKEVPGELVEDDVVNKRVFFPIGALAGPLLVDLRLILQVQ